jgi:hypothetical protein
LIINPINPKIVANNKVVDFTDDDIGPPTPPGPPGEPGIGERVFNVFVKDLAGLADLAEDDFDLLLRGINKIFLFYLLLNIFYYFLHIYKCI